MFQNIKMIDKILILIFIMLARYFSLAFTSISFCYSIVENHLILQTHIVQFSIVNSRLTNDLYVSPIKKILRTPIVL